MYLLLILAVLSVNPPDILPDITPDILIDVSSTSPKKAPQFTIKADQVKPDQAKKVAMPKLIVPPPKKPDQSVAQPTCGPGGCGVQQPAVTPRRRWTPLFPWLRR